MSDVIDLLSNRLIPLLGAAVGGLFAIDVKAVAVGSLAILFLIIMDQITGVMVAKKNKTFSSKLFLSMTVKKLISYFVILTVLGLAGIGLETLTGTFGKIVGFLAFGYGVVIIIVSEVYSILENLQALGYTIKIGNKDIVDDIQKKLLDRVVNDEEDDSTSIQP